MEVKVDQGALAEALAGVSRANTPGLTIPVLAGVRLRARDGWLVLQATDLELALERQVPAVVSAPGDAVVPGRLLADLCRRLPGGEVALRLEDGGRTMHVRAGKSRFQLQVVAAEQFPQKFQPLPAGALQASLQPDVLLAAIRHTVFVVDRENHREYLRGVRLAVAGERLSAVATDSVRIAHLTAGLPDAPEQQVAVTLPVRSAAELARLLAAATAAGEEQVVLAVDGTRLLCAGAGWRLEAQLLAGEYPDLLGLVPRTYRGRVQVDRAGLQAALERCLVVDGDVCLQPEPGQLRLRSVRPEAGDAEELVAVRATGGELPARVWFAGRLLLEPKCASSFARSGSRPGSRAWAAAGSSTWCCRCCAREGDGRMDVQALAAAIGSGTVTAVRYREMHVGPHVLRYGWVDLRDGDANPRADGDRLVLDLWFPAGMFPGVAPLAEQTVRKARDRFWLPGGVYRLERHTVALVGAEPITESVTE